jgi:hypothetical protein
VADRSPLESTVALGDGRIRLVWAEAGVDREAAEISRQAAALTAAIRTAAEREAAALRAAIMDMPAATTDLPAAIADRPAGLGGVVHAQPATKPRIHPGAGTKGRQVRAMRKAQVAFAILALVGVMSGSAEIAAHGFSFFLFRNTGAGAGNPQNLNENQGPGQLDAPGVHHKTHPR